MGLRQVHIACFTIICILLCIPSSNAQDSYDEKHIEVSLRMIGHQVLLSSGDSTSHVLPIIKMDDQYEIHFDSEFEFTPEELVDIVKQVVAETSMAEDYIVEVKKCETERVVYGYEVDGSDESDIIPCKTRAQPKACYKLVFTLIEKNEVNYLSVGIPLVLIAGLLFLLWKRRPQSPIDPNLVPLGKYHFDKRNTELVFEHQRIELTSKEADLLLLLYDAVNTTIEREVILNRVWGDEGAYIGRTLDVFISKLRKKLKADSSVKIVNIRGVGYKLVVDV